jgi:hypothetical protein
MFLVWFEIVTISQDETKKLAKFVQFSNLYLFKIDCQKKWHIATTINIVNKKFQNISFENSSLWKHVFWAKWPLNG